MAKNKGKQFEQVVYQSFSKVDNVSIDRIPDQVTRYKGSSQNICDFIVYRKPIMVYAECKSVHGNTLPIYSNPKEGKDGKLHGFHGVIRDNQWDGLLEKSKIDGVVAGILCWWVDKDVTKFIPIQMLEQYYIQGAKSVRYDDSYLNAVNVSGVKKRVYFEYDMEVLLDRLEWNYLSDVRR